MHISLVNKSMFQLVTNVIKERIDTDKVIIAGGCIRDAFLNKEIKDIDVFVDVEPQKLEEIFGIENKVTGFNNPYWFDVYNIIIPTVPYPVQVINMYQMPLTTQNLFDTFDTGICMAAWDNVLRSIIVSPKFTNDVNHKTITVYKPFNNDHGIRMALKFPEYDFLYAIPPADHDHQVPFKKLRPRKRKLEIPYEDREL